MSQTGYMVWFLVTTLVVTAIIIAGIGMAMNAQRHSMHDPHPH